MLRSEKTGIPVDSLLCAGGAAEISRWWSAARNHRNRVVIGSKPQQGRQTTIRLSPFQGWRVRFAFPVVARRAPPPANLRCASGAKKLPSLAVKLNR